MPTPAEDIEVAPAIAVQPNDVAVVAHEKAPVVVELPVMAEGTIEGDATPVLALKPPVDAAAGDPEVLRVQVELAAVQINLTGTIRPRQAWGTTPGRWRKGEL